MVPTWSKGAWTACMLAHALDAAVDAGAEGVLPAFIEAVEGWHPLQIVTGYWLHEAIRSALRLGKYDPSDCTLTQCQKATVVPAHSL